MSLYQLVADDCRHVLSKVPANTFHACICDPPYAMNMAEWDKAIPGVEVWEAVFNGIKPGGFVLASSSTPLYHNLANNIEGAGFKIMDFISWINPTKMPVSKNRLKPAQEVFAVGQKPFEVSLKSNQLRHGCGIINIDAGRIPWPGKPPVNARGGHDRRRFGKLAEGAATYEYIEAHPGGRYPSNVIGDFEGQGDYQKHFFAPTASRKERGEYNDHPTPEPIALMGYLVKLFSHEGSLVLDPFCGSGSTGIAALNLNRQFFGIDLSERYLEITRRRIADHCHTDKVAG